MAIIQSDMAGLVQKIKPWQWGLAGGALTALVLLSGLFRCGEMGVEIGLATAMAAAVGITVYLLVRAKAYAWLTVFLLGLILGLESAVELFLEVVFERQCSIALITALFWVVLCFTFGALAEIIRLLHRLAHKVGEGAEERLKEHLAKKGKSE